MPVTHEVPESSATRAEIEDFLYYEAQLIDGRRLEEWLTLFTEDGLYWIPMDETKPASVSAAIIYDTPLRREERVHHLLQIESPSRRPPSRTVHFISNVTAEESTNKEILVHSSQLVFELRLGDFRQTGLGELRSMVATVDHVLRSTPAGLRIACKKILLIDRDLPQQNLNFLL